MICNVAGCYQAATIFCLGSIKSSVIVKFIHTEIFQGKYSPNLVHIYPFVEGVKEGWVDKPSFSLLSWLFCDLQGTLVCFVHPRQSKSGSKQPYIIASYVLQCLCFSTSAQPFNLKVHLSIFQQLSSIHFLPKSCHWLSEPAFVFLVPK